MSRYVLTAEAQYDLRQGSEALWLMKAVSELPVVIASIVTGFRALAEPLAMGTVETTSRGMRKFGFGLFSHT